MEEDTRAIYVTVDGTRTIVRDLSWETTAGDIIRLLKPSLDRRGPPQMLVESWRGCVRRVGEKEYVCKILEEWGEEARNVGLILTNSHSFPGLRYARRKLDWSKIYTAQKHGKVASNKKRSLSRIVTPKKGIGKEIARLVARAQVAKERLDAVEALQIKLERAQLFEYPSVGLSPREEEEWMALQELLTEEEEEEKQLEERKREISERIKAQKIELTATMQQNEKLERKLSQENEKWKSLKTGQYSTELRESQNEIESLRKELRTSHKQSQLLNKKMQEVSSKITALDLNGEQETDHTLL